MEAEKRIMVCNFTNLEQLVIKRKYVDMNTRKIRIFIVHKMLLLP